MAGQQPTSKEHAASSGKTPSPKHDTQKPISAGSVQEKSGKGSVSGDLSGRPTPSQAEGNEKDVDESLRRQPHSRDE